MEQDTAALGSIRVDGGASANDFLMQFQADILGRELLRPAQTESTAQGAAYLAGLAAGIWSSTEELLRMAKHDRVFRPAMEETQRQALLHGWEDAVRRTMTR